MESLVLVDIDLSWLYRAAWRALEQGWPHFCTMRRGPRRQQLRQDWIPTSPLRKNKAPTIGMTSSTRHGSGTS